MIVWPRGPFRIRPPHGRGALIVSLVFATIFLAILIALCRSSFMRQPVLNLLATFGAGETVEGVDRDWIHCWGAGSGRSRVHHCDLDLVLPSGRRETIFMYSAANIEDSGVGRVARFGDDFGVVLSDGALLGPLLMSLIMLALAFVPLWLSLIVPLRFLRTARRGRLAKEGRIVDADLLRKVNVFRHSAEWDYAFHHGGSRRYARARLRLPPAQADPIETRGAALVTPDGKSHLLDIYLDPLDLKAEQVSALVDAMNAESAAYVPHLTPALERLIADAPEGPRREFLQAWLDAWTPDAAATTAARERRHAAARRLPREEVDRLLQQVRAAARP